MLHAILSFPKLSHFNLPSLKRAGMLLFLEFRSAIVSCPLELLLKAQKVKTTTQILIEEQAWVSTCTLKCKVKIEKARSRMTLSSLHYWLQ